MGRTARIGLFLLMGLIVALARLVEVELGKLRPDPKDSTALMVKPVVKVPPVASKKKAATEKPAKTPIGTPVVAVPLPPEAEEWPKGPVYTVKRGETLGEISAKVLGSSRHWQKLLDANATVIASPQALKPGMKLTIPK